MLWNMGIYQKLHEDIQSRISLWICQKLHVDLSEQKCYFNLSEAAYLLVTSIIRVVQTHLTNNFITELQVMTEG